MFYVKTLYRLYIVLYIDILSTLCQHYVDTISTFYRPATKKINNFMIKCLFETKKFLIYSNVIVIIEKYAFNTLKATVKTMYW